jgi:hypothetical protein
MLKEGGDMRKKWPIVVTFFLFVGGTSLTHYNLTTLGMLIMLAGLLTAWIWALWPDIQQWLVKRK